MAPKTLLETIRRKKSSEFVESAVVHQGPDIGGVVMDDLRVDAREGEEIPDIPFFIELLGRRLRRSREVMLEASRQHLAELAGDDEERQKRETAMAALTDDYISLRNICVYAFGQQEAEKLGFERSVARDAAALEMQIERLVGNLLDPDLVPPQSRYPGIDLLPADVAAKLQPNLEMLQEVRAALDSEQRGADSTLLAKNAAVEANDREFGAVSRCLETMFVLAGQSELARRIRPSARRPGRLLELPDEDEDTGTEETESAVVQVLLEEELSDPTESDSVS